MRGPHRISASCLLERSFASAFGASFDVDQHVVRDQQVHLLQPAQLVEEQAERRPGDDPPGRREQRGPVFSFDARAPVAAPEFGAGEGGVSATSSKAASNPGETSSTRR